MALTESILYKSEEIDNIWSKNSVPKYKNTILSLSPKYAYIINYYPDGKKEDIRFHFIGLNPSFNVSKLKNIVNKYSVEEIYNFKNKNKSYNGGTTNGDKTYFDIINEIDKESITKYPRYFGTILELSNKFKFSFSYSDLFLFRCSSQSELIQNLEKMNTRISSYLKLNSFLIMF